MKLMYKCGNIEDIKMDNKTMNFVFKDCQDGHIELVCKRCNEIVFIKSLMNSQ